jgi:hypothetical protein
MTVTLPLDKMTIPEWHGDMLKEREKRLKQGKDKFVDWEDAKKDILDSVLC